MQGLVQMCRRGSTLVAIVAALWMAGCATAGGDASWPDVEPPAEAPSAGEGEPELVRGDDGLIYAVGEFDTQPEAGQTVLGRHGGQWPLEETSRPALFAGEVVEAYGDGVVRVHPLYEFPDTDIGELTVDVVDDRGEETMSKGLGRIREINGESNEIGMSLGSEEGVREGDMYAVMANYQGDGDPARAQLTRRLRGICMVVSVDSEGSDCRLHGAHPAHPEWPEIRRDHQMVFLEPSFGDEPREGTVMISPTGDEEVDDWIVDHLDSYLQRMPGGNAGVEVIDERAEATDENFHRWSRKIDTGDEPTILVGTTLRDVDGERRLVLNYTGIGTAAGPGMVAAPPEGGVGMGPVEEVDEEDWQSFGSVVMGAMMVYRGQTAAATGHLHRALRDGALEGPWRWHSRDQYAMRWAAVDRFEEALWLVYEDEAVARADDNRRARRNAVGTRVRLHDYLDQNERAAELAEQYLEWRRADDSESGHLSALAMYAEMVVQTGGDEEARQAVDELLERCPEGCRGDVIPLLAGVYWAAGETNPEFQDELVETMVDFGEEYPENSLASARMFQGWTFMREEDFDQALIAFLEAERLFEERENSPYGVARAQFYIALTQVSRGEPQKAFEYGMEARDYMTEIGDYESTARIYERLAEIYIDIDTGGRPEEFMVAGSEILQSGMEMQLGAGDYGGAAEAGFGYGHYLFRAGNVEEARYTLQRAVTRAIRVARFDTVAMCHVFLAVIARSEGNMERYREELSRAETMADIVDQPHIQDLIEELRSGPEQPDESDDPTQLL